VPGDKPKGEPELAGAPSSYPPNLKETPPGSMDRVSMTDPIWDFSGTQNGPISIKRLSGEVDTIDPSIEDEPDDAGLNPEEELGISEGTIGGPVRTESRDRGSVQRFRLASAQRDSSGVQTPRG